MADLLSVGIDIGTTTTQLIFSKIKMENTTGYFAVPRISIVDKEILYQSEVHLTPLLTETLIDSDGVREIVAQEYQKAGIVPSSVDTGAVIITGESARKENARAVMERLSAFAGEFVVSTAGPDLESVIAGKGSGAWAYSLDHHCEAVNLDIGGGTTNIVVFSEGDVIAKGCFDIGGRLIRVENGRITHISPSAKLVAESLGLSVQVGNAADAAQLSKITDRMAELLAESLGLLPKSALLDAVTTNNSTPLTYRTKPKTAVFYSGGVANRIEPLSAEPFPYGDIGALLGASVFRGTLFGETTVQQSTQTIRATVVGAGMFTTTVSGSTITCTSAQFPMKNIPVLKLTPDEQEQCFLGNVQALISRIRWFCEQSETEQLVLALPGKENPEFPEAKRLAVCLADALEQTLPKDAPLLVLIETDIAKAVGILMRSVLGSARDVVCIDCVRVEQGDYMDLGKPLFDGLVIPIVVKSLLFG